MLKCDPALLKEVLTMYIMMYIDAWLILIMMPFKAISHRVLSPQNSPDLYYFNVAVEKNFRLTSLGNKSYNPYKLAHKTTCQASCVLFLCLYFISTGYTFA